MATRQKASSTRKDAPVALFDLDGTLADFDEAMKLHMMSLAGPTEKPWDADAEEDEPPFITARRRIIKSVPGFWTGLRKMEDGFEILDCAHTIGFRLMVLSRGPSQNSLAWMEKIDWCRANIPHKHEITLTEDKGLVYGRFLVDDWPDYILRWLEFRPRGIVIMPARSWNEKFKHPQVYRYSATREPFRRTRPCTNTDTIQIVTLEKLLQQQFSRAIASQK